MQLVLHAPFGSRVNRAWGLALRKRFCRQFNFELQAAATEDARAALTRSAALVPAGDRLPLPPAGDGARHPGPGAARRPDVRHPLALERHDRAGPAAESAADARCRRSSSGWRRRTSSPPPSPTPPPVWRTSRAIVRSPIIPLVRQTIDDCLHEVMDLDGLIAMLHRIQAGEIRCVARDLPEPSPLAHEILNARPYAFPRRRTARGATHPGGVHAPCVRARLRRRSRRARSGEPSSGCGTRSGPRCARRRAARRPAHLRLPDPGGNCGGRVDASWTPWLDEPSGREERPSIVIAEADLRARACRWCSRGADRRGKGAARRRRGPRVRRPRSCCGDESGSLARVTAAALAVSLGVSEAETEHGPGRARGRRVWCCAGGSPRARRSGGRSSGASGGFWPGSIGTRSTASVRRSSR